MLNSDILISDWSGAAFEFSFGLCRPVLFIDVPRKINNPEYELIKLEPIEVRLRECIGAVLAPSELSKIPQILITMVKNAPECQRKIRLEREKCIYHIGNSGRVAASELINLLGTSSE